MSKPYGGLVLGVVLAAALAAALPAAAKVQNEYEFKDGLKTMAVGAYTDEDTKLGTITFSEGDRDFPFGLAATGWLRLRDLYDAASGRSDAASSQAAAWRQVGEVSEAGADASRLTLFAGPNGHVRFVLHDPANRTVSVEIGERDAVVFSIMATRIKHYLLSKECSDLFACDKANK